MKKTVTFLLVFALMVSGLAGCGKNEEPAASYGSTQQTVVPSFWEANLPQQTDPFDVDTFLVHAYVSRSWGTPNVWAWSTTEGDACDAWPGWSMDYYGYGWFTCEVPEWVNYVVISSEDGNQQTADIQIQSRDVWIALKEDGSGYVSYDGYFDLPEEDTSEFGYISELVGQWEKVRLEDGSQVLNVTAQVYDQTVYYCSEMTVNMNVQMNAGTNCKDWQVWGRCGGSFVKIGSIYLAAGDGYTSQKLTFSTPITFDAIAITPKIPGGYSWSMNFSITDISAL